MSKSSEPPAGRINLPPSRDALGAEGATLEDVARLADVHPATVSRAINRPDMVSPKTLERVRAVIEQIGYVPNLLAGGLASNRSRLVAAIVPSVGTAMFAEAVEVLTERLRQAGYEVLLGLTGFHRSREDELVSAVLGRRPDAVVLTGIDHSAKVRRQLMTARIPVVECWDLTPSPIDIVIGFSHEKAGRAAAMHLLSRGHDDLAVIAASDTRALRRRAGFLEVLAERGIAPRSMETTETPGSHRLGRAAFAALTDTGRLPRALFCTSDPLAQGAVTEAQVRGLRVPHDIAIMGFGDFPDSSTTSPSLTSIFFDRQRIGDTAATSILQELQGAPIVDRIIDIGFRIIGRESA
jgi:LacI family gluconate utilization system Gnt-I transcriptional repressor